MRSKLGTGDGPTGIGVMAELAKQFGDDEAALNEAWDKIEGFRGGIAQKILSESGGDWDDLKTCGSKLQTAVFTSIDAVQTCVRVPGFKNCPETKKQIFALLG